MGIRIGLTGTRRELTNEQFAWLKARLEQYYRKDSELHHGDCVGTDLTGFVIASELGYRTIAHPPVDSRLRAYTKSDEILPIKFYRERNEDIANDSEVLLIIPLGPESDYPRSSTWQTARYARRSGCPTRNWWYEREVGGGRATS